MERTITNGNRKRSNARWFNPSVNALVIGPKMFEVGPITRLCWIINGNYQARMCAAYTTRRLNIFGRCLRLPNYCHQAETGNIESDLNHVCRKTRSEEHTSELQSRGHLVCRLLLEK